MNLRYLYPGILFTILLLPCKAAGQISGSAGYSLLFTDNPLHLSDNSDEYISSYTGNISYYHAATGLGAVYELGFDHFRNTSDRTSYYHTVQLDYSISSDDTLLMNGLFTNASYSYKNNSDGNTPYKYSLFSFGLNGQYWLRDNIIVSGLYDFSYKNYPVLYDLTNNDNSLFISISASFETNTALNLGLFLGQRKYTMNDTVSVFYSGQQHGHGQGSASKVVSAVTEKQTSVTQYRYIIKLSQSVWENTGMNIYYQYRNNLNNTSYISASEFMYSDDDDLWDDPYSFDGNETGGTITQILPWNMTLTCSGSYSKRSYLNNAADTTGSKNRFDIKRTVALELSKTFDDILSLISLAISAEYMYTSNTSNEGFFSYRNNIIALGISASF